MQAGGERRIDAPREVVWAALNDPDILRKCIPGCKSVDRVSDNEIHALATTMLGAVEASFMSKVTLLTLDPPKAYRIAGESHGGTNSLAGGSADVRLQPASATSTLLKYDVDATLDGKTVQLGQLEIEQTAQKMTNDFFARFNETLNRRTQANMDETISEPAVADYAFNPGFWLAAILALITLVLYLMALI